jgi:Na+/proline symporter
MIDALLVAAFVAYCLGVGLRSRRQSSRDLEAYFLAGRRLSPWQSGLSMAATQYAADTPLLAAGLVATGGVFALWRLWSYGIAFLALGFLLGAAWWRAGVVTDAELCELRYGGRPAAWLRGLKTLFYGVVFNCAVLAMVMAAAVRIAEPFLPWDRWLPGPLFEPVERLAREVGVLLTTDAGAADAWRRTASNLISVAALYVFTLLYSTTGGLRAVVRTDVVQIAIAFAATGVYALFAVRAAGGLAALPETLGRALGPERARELLAFDPWSAAGVGGALLGVLGLQWLAQMNSDGTGYLAQRCMACRSPREARQAPVIFAFVQILGRSVLWLPILIALLVVFPLEDGQSAAERETTFVRGIETLLPPGARGLMLVGMLAALASTLDTHLNWGASYLSNDLYGRLWCRGLRRREPAPRELVWAARLSSPLLVAISLALMSVLGSIQAAWHATLLLGAGLGVPLLSRWLWRRANAWGEIAAIGASALAAPLLLVFVREEAQRLLAAAAIGATVSLAASLATAPEASERLDAFWERARPPGFWGRPGASKALLRRLLALAAAAGTLYASLLAFGTWLLGAPAPLGLGRAAWVAACLGLALALVPAWLPELRSPEEE